MNIPAGYKNSEVGVIPVDWDVIQMDEIGETLIGLTYSPKSVASDGVLVHRSSNIQNNQLAYEDNVFVEADVKEHLILKEGDILICSRNGSRKLIGKSALIKGKAVGETFGAFMSVFRTDENSGYIFNLIISDVVQRQISLRLGATINQITNKTLNEFKIPLPPTQEERQAIATTLSEIEALVLTLEDHIAKKNAIKQASMQQLLMPSSQGGKRLPGYTGEWTEKSLSQISHSLVRGPFGGALKKEHFVSSGYKVYEQKNAIYANVELGDYYITESKYKEFQKYEVQIGDFIMSCSGTIGKILRIPASYEPGIINQALMKITINKSQIDDTYFYHQFKWDKYQSKVIDDTQGGAMKNLVGMDKFRTTLMPCPPSMIEQQAIASILSDMDQELEALKRKKLKYEHIKRGMMQELLLGKTRLI